MGDLVEYAGNGFHLRWSNLYLTLMARGFLWQLSESILSFCPWLCCDKKVKEGSGCTWSASIDVQHTIFTLALNPTNALENINAALNSLVVHSSLQHLITGILLSQKL